MNTKKNKLALPLILSALVLTACGSSDGGAYTNYSVAKDSAESRSNGYSEYNYETYDYESADAEESGAASNSPDSENGLGANQIRREMLVYSCDIRLDTLDFGKSLDGFKERLDYYGGFVEEENYSDGGSGGRWYYYSEEKWQSYSATVRVPSKDYDNFCSDVSALGDLRSKNASVDNVSSEYYDLSVTLEIYQAKENRYIQLLADITDDEYALQVEKELTQLQIEIARLKTRMNAIETDVAYSYVDITINEVKEYTAEPVKTDTFFQRLSNTVKSTASGFANFLEWALFALIGLLPYAVFFGVIIFIILKIRKAVRKRRAANYANYGGAEIVTGKLKTDTSKTPPEYNYTKNEKDTGSEKKEDKSSQENKK